MEANPRGYRDRVTGRFARRPVEGVDAESRFDPMGDDIPVDIVSGAPSPSTIDRPRHAPEGDTLAGPSYPGRLRPRTARLISSQDDGTTEWHAIPDRATLHFNAMREAAGPHAGDLDPVRYLIGDLPEVRE
jgi:hypothetical protein